MCPGLIVPIVLKFGNPAALKADNEWTEEYLVTPWAQILGPDDLVSAGQVETVTSANTSRLTIIHNAKQRANTKPTREMQPFRLPCQKLLYCCESHQDL